MDEILIQEEKVQYAESQLDVISQTRKEIEGRFGLYFNLEDLFIVLQEIRPCRGKCRTTGDYFDAREYNLGEKDFETVWDLMRDNCDKIKFDLPCKIDVAKIIVRTAMKMNT